MTTKSILLAMVSCIGLTACSFGNSDPPPPRPVVSLLEERHQDVVIQKWDISCGAAALATVLHYQFGKPINERDVADDILHHTNIEQVRAQLGFSLLDLKQYLQRHGMDGDGYGDLKLGDLLVMGHPIVPVFIRGFNHFEVFRGIMGDRVLLADPAWGNRTMSISWFLARWQSRIGFKVEQPKLQMTMTVAPPKHIDRLVAKPNDFISYSLAFAAPKKNYIPPDQRATPDDERALADASDTKPLATAAAGYPVHE